MAIGGSAQVALSNRKTLIRKRLHKQLAARRMLLESLEGRQLMAVGPQLLGIQPNQGSLLVDGQVRQIAPNELVFRFDDRVGLDSKSLDGIRLIRAGSDGEFERASMATDLGTGGQSLVEFYAAEPGQVGNGIQISFTQVNRSDSRAPVVRVSGRNVSVEVNSNPLLETRVDDLVRAFDQSIAANTVTNLVYALRLRGSTTIGIGRTVNTTAPVVLGGANAAKVTTDFGTGANLQVRLNAKNSGADGIGIEVEVKTRDFGGPGSPIITVAGKKITVELNSNSRNASTVADFIAALNGNASSSALVEATLISGVSATRLGTLSPTYSPLVLSGVSDIEIIPGYVGLGDTSREVIMRFASALPDDRYRIEILGRGSRALLNLNGEAFNDGIDKAVSFELDLGAQIESIVPQPVERNALGQLTQATNRIDVYFNNDDLINPGAIRTVNGLTIDQLRVQRPALFFQSSDIIVLQTGATITPDVLSPQFYQLYHLAGTLTNTDDTRILPTAIRYFPDADRVQLTFSRPLSDLVDPSNSNALPMGELRLRIGTNDPKPLPPISYTPVLDAADTFTGADNLSMWTPATGSQSILINSQIKNTTPYALDFPGGSDEIGGRYNRMEDHFRRRFALEDGVPFTIGDLAKADSTDGTTTVLYNFQTQLGSFTGTTLLNSITEQQKQRAREVLSLYERYLGVRFVETENLGMTIAVGDTRAVRPFPETSLSASAGVITLNSQGAEFLESGILATTGQLATVLDSQDFAGSTDNNFGGAFSRAVAQGIGNLLGMGGTDDLEGFTTQAFDSILAPGVGTEIVLPGDAEIIHGQYLFRPDSKDIDLYQFSLPVSGRISIETFAERMSSASLLDTQIRLYRQLSSGKWEEVAANDDYYSSDSFVELELGAGNYIVGVSASGNNQYDPTISDSGLGGRSEGGYQLRMDFRAPSASVLKDATGVPMDGDADSVPGGVFDYWFRPGNASNTKFVDKQAAAGGNGTLAAPYKNIKDALSAAQPGDVVRIVGNGGADGKLNTVADNLAYEIGFTALGAALPDGTTLDVPKDVSVFIDAGAILKLRRSRIGVGSTSASVDRSGGSLMVLGTPVLIDSAGAVLKDSTGLPSAGSVYFTSIADGSLGTNTGNGTSPLAGDWGGIDFRNRVDSQDETRKNYEKRGQFLNWVSHADVRYGGGQVVVDGVSQAITPIQMVDSRPSVVFSKITTSADAAMSATPNSFLESNFHTPDEQRAGVFSTDYSRVGPEIHGNTLTGNSLNGLQVRVRTTGSTLETMTVAGRFDDTDIVHIIPENLTIAGTPGGFISDSIAPPTTIVTLVAQTGGTLTAGTYSYRMTYVDASGNESVASVPTTSLTVAAGSQIVLQNLPPVRSGSSYVARRLYRSDSTGAANYVLVRELNASSTTIVDTGTSLGSPLVVKTVATRSRLDGRLAVDGGTVVKLQGSRIEVQFGAQLIAEGTPDRKVVFTSTSDVRYGAGGTFATSASSAVAAKGNWGGIYLAPTAIGSFDQAVIAYGGGTTRIEGGFAEFSALEAQQADLRLSNTRLELNASGNANGSSSDRGGRGTNENSVVFVRGAQPVLVDNVVINNDAAAFSINVSALNNTIVTDPGRSTGALGRTEDRPDNQGPLVVGNRLDKNSVNGLVIRGGILTTEGVWDDTDIVHVVREDVEVPNFHTYGGLRLQSSATQSLVVKLDGAGITANGELIDNADRIGGSVQLIGTPGNPVLMTSINDCTVGVGFTPSGLPQTDTLNTSCGSTTIAPFADVVVVMDDSGSMTFAQQFSAQLIQDLDKALLAAGIGSSNQGANRYGLVAYGGAFTDTVPEQILIGTGNTQWGTAAQYATGVNTLTAGGFLEDGYLAIEYALDNYAFRQAGQKFVIIVTNEDRDIIDSSKSFASTLTKLRRKGAILDGIVESQFFDANSRQALALDYKDQAYLADGNGGYTVSPNGFALDYPFFSGTTIEDYVDLIHASQGIAGDIEQIQAGGVTTTSFSNALITTIVAQASGNNAAPGDWRSVLIGANSNDRNVAVATELETPRAVSPGSNSTPETAEYLGELAPDLKTSDEVRRLGFQVQGVISEGSDLDVYSFRATAGTEVWMDIDRTLNSLDTVVELIDANGRILAMSDNSAAEEANSALLYSASDLAAQSVHSLRKSTPELYLKSALGAPKDLYSTNPRDAGMRVVLPGEPGSVLQYHLRVRSSNLRAGDAVARLLDPNFLNAGLTRGAYQLQLRLREEDEIPGSSVTYADMRFATNGIEIEGTRHSPLLGETAETDNPNNTIGTAQAVGNVLTTDKQAISIAGNLANSFNDVDWYSFTINYTAIRPTGLREYFSTVFDVDYADGIGRPDTSIYVFDNTGRLILGGLGSNLVDDQAGGLNSSSDTDLSRGSSGSLDPYIGAVELPVGQYFLAVTNSSTVPQVLQAYTNATVSGATAAIRLQPTNGIQLIAEDHIGSTGGSTAVTPSTPVLFPTGNTNVQFNLSDVSMYVSQQVGTNASNLYMVNPMTGEVSNTVGRFQNNVQDLAFRYNGELRAFDISPQFPNVNVDQDTLMDYLQIDPGTAAATDTGDLGLSTFHVDGTNAADSNDGIYPNAVTFASIGGQERGFIVGSRGPLFPRANVGTSRPGVSYLSNIIYEFDETSGAATSSPAADKTGIATALDAGTAVRERGYIETSNLGAITGLIAREATTVSATGVTTRVIRDGNSFTLLDSSNFTAIFEFDSGPEVLVNYNPARGLVITDGLQFKLDGVTYEFDVSGGVAGVTPGANAIPLAANATFKQLIDAITLNIGSSITVSNEGNRLNFQGALVGDFTQMQNAGIFTDLGSSGNVSPGAIKVPFLASDTAADIAARMVIAINSSGIPGLSATASGVQVNLTGGIVTNSGPLFDAGAPGGTITGAAVINGVMYAVSNTGGLFRVNSPTSLTTGNVGTYLTSSYELLGIQFAGLTAGPTHLQNGAFAQTLFGIDDNGVLYAFDTSGHLLPIFAGGATSVDTGLVGSTGITFSTLDYNLWHVSSNRGSEDGHGLPVTPDSSRGTAVQGGSSLYFGFESPGANGVNLSSVTDPGNRNNYNFPGGAAGAIESQAIDLSGLSSGDLPTLYFNYRFDTENAAADLPLGQSLTDYMRDSLRVYVSGEDGQWVLAATSNSARGAGSFDDEFDPFVGGYFNADGQFISSEVQELFDNNGQWRQARVPLDAFAGQANVKLRVEFSSAGGFGFGMTGGKGPQLRMISGDRLQDGQTVTVAGQVFELEMGPSLVLPAGSSLTAGDSVTVEGVTYVFTDGSIAVTAPNVAVSYTASQSASQIAASLQAAIRTAVRPQPLVILTATEQNDTMNTALIGSLTGDSALITVNGNIGDNAALSDPTSDVDMVRVDLARGATVVADVLALTIGSPLDSYLRVFDSQGNQLAANDNRVGSTDSRITFTAPKDGTYYFAVSGAGNTAYKAAVFATGAAGSSGNYQMTLNVLRQLNALQSGSRLQLEGAAHVSVPPNSRITLQGAQGTTGVPVYVNVGMTANQVGQALQTALANTYASGLATAFPLQGDTLDLTGLVQYDSIDPGTFRPAPSAAQLSPGPFGATTSFAGDRFSAFNASTDFAGNRSNANPGALRAQNNGFEGVYLDDFIIGLAGRGEMVLNAPVDTTFIPDPQLTRTEPDLSNPEVLVGPYQVEIRGGTEYAQPLLDGFPTTLFLQDALSLQERLGEGLSMRFNGASGFSAGSTFTISDGTRTLTFELDDIDDQVSPQPGNVPFTFSNKVLDATTGAFRSETAGVIAARFRDLINSSAVQSVLDIRAVLLNSDASGQSNNTVVLVGQVNANVPTNVATTTVSKGSGDSNREREQGQIVIQSAKISQSAGFGVRINSAGRDAQGNPIGGTPRNLLSLNTDRLVPGPVIMNSTLIDNLSGGISIAGEPTAANTVPASVPYARIINNTIVGTNGRSGAGATGETGISVTNNASPTLINNVLTNLAVGLNIDASSASTIVGGTVFHRNLANLAGAASNGQFAIVVDNTTEVFRDVANGNLYPAAGSPIIDSAIDSLQDRTSLVTVKNAIGVGASPILAPQYDVNGLLRVDDPAVSSPSGLGENVFKDRGAADRADFVGPSVVMLFPVDNDIAGVDTNPAESVIELTNFTANYFDIQMYDGLEPSDPNRGSNIDDATVTSASVLVYENGVPLVEGIDYRFGYDATSNIIRLTPLAGVFSSSSVYQIRFVNSREFGITTLRGRDYSDGSTITIVDANKQTTTFELDTGFLLNIPSADGIKADIVEGSVLTLDDGVRRLTFELDKDGSTNVANIAIKLTTDASPTEVGQRIQAAIQAAAMQFTVVDLGSGRLQVDGSSISSFDVGTSGIKIAGKPGVQPAFGIQIPLVAGRPVTLLDGETFTINRTTSPVTFELDTNGVVTAGRTAVRFTAGASAATIGQALVTAIRNAGLGLLPSYAGNGLVVLGGDVNTVLNVTNTQLKQAGTPGKAASQAIKISAAASIDEAAIANQIASVINTANLPGVSATAFGDRVVIAGAESVGGDQAALIQAITDSAGNVLKPNQANGQTTLTIFLGEGLDYGDAPDPKYASKRDSNGARHTVVTGLSLGANVRPDADAKTPNLDEFDDGVTFSTMVAAFQSSISVQVTRPTGTTVYLSGWIDYNQDGVFAATEKIASSQPITGTSTGLSFIVPASALNGTTYARFRMSTVANAVANPTGLAPDGEVEDYAITIVGNPYKNQTLDVDVNADGKVSPIDALQVINYLNSSSPKVLTLPHTAAAPYVDVNGDGQVTALDALLVINYLNTVPPTGEGEGQDVGAGVEEVSTVSWINGIEQLAAPSAASGAAPMVASQVIQSEGESSDAFFADLSSDSSEPAVMLAASSTSTSVHDVALNSLSTSASEIADDVVTGQANWMLRQRLASFFKK